MVHSRIFKLCLSLVQFTPRGDNQKISPGEQRNLRRKNQRIVAEEPWLWDQRVNALPAHGNLRLVVLA
ncbi:hypothetical protein EMPG_14837 [Blastomyces silverae]|uniref:Uncharacterized protein n=1 Tax=Blastomyces silverae TaxID=2060906 RepID=A0A0H1BE35_9EURO|nr:hypothetical protein EMPG_14837 [Blastomyces silverae]